jgi:hypothetical protein
MIADTDGLGIDHTVQGDQCDFSGTAADVDNHRTASLFDRQAGTDGRSHWLFDQEDFARTGTQSRFTDGATLDLSGFAGNTDQHTRAGLQKAVLVNLVDKILKHLFAHAEVGNNAVFHRSNGGNVARGTAQHPLGFHPDSNNALLISVGPNGHN